MRPSPFHSHPDRTSPTGHPQGFAPSPDPDSNSSSHQRSPKPGASTAIDALDGTGDSTQRAAYHRNSSSDDDVERNELPAYEVASDPFRLRSCLKTNDEIANIKANTSRKRSGKTCTPVTKGKDALHTNKIKGFYEAQNENIERLLKPVDEHVRQAKDQQGSEALQFKIAVNGSFVANVCLAILQLYGAIASGSLSLFTTMADSIFDPLSNLTLILCARAVNRVDPRKYPSGKARIENAGNIVFCFLMTAVSLVLIVMSARDLAAGNGGEETTNFHLPAVIAVSVAFCTKLVLFIYCWSLRNKYSQIRILWEDHRNDLVINGFGIMTSVGGSKLKWWIDPMGAIILSTLIATLWLRTAYGEFQLLIGVSADTSFLQHITYISMTHSPAIHSLDTVRAWHSGPRLIVEVDIVMDPEQTLRETHDVAEELQMKLESLPDVERAYVHVDYETSHAPEHFWKKEL
ncbi:hypothetical protein MBLNU230_g7372t1 [Neophaeotheca triangularis]